MPLHGLAFDGLPSQGMGGSVYGDSLVKSENVHVDLAGQTGVAGFVLVVAG